MGVKNDPEWVQRERLRRARYARERMRNDPIWREKVNAYRRQAYADKVMVDPDYLAQRALRARQWRAKHRKIQ